MAGQTCLRFQHRWVRNRNRRTQTGTGTDKQRARRTLNVLPALRSLYRQSVLPLKPLVAQIFGIVAW